MKETILEILDAIMISLAGTIFVMGIALVFGHLIETLFKLLF